MSSRKFRKICVYDVTFYIMFGFLVCTTDSVIL